MCKGCFSGHGNVWFWVEKFELHMTGSHFADCNQVEPGKEKEKSGGSWCDTVGMALSSSNTGSIQNKNSLWSEYDTLGTSIKAALVYLGTALVKLVCLATFLKVSENDSFDPYQELLKALIGFIDVAGLYFALTQLTHRNISQNHKFQAVGLGWAFADSVLHRLAPLWVGARGLEFTWDFILQGLEANANLVLSISLAALGSLMWLRKNKPKTLIPIIYACAGIVATMPSITRSATHLLFLAYGQKLPEKRIGMAFSKGCRL
ncbi:hypothetical protein D5086_025561 [Populus alba]|uniref:Uncharacterized protein n=1 Tax=Populus alba TaxID=43335 RepID=A0ACC4B0B8_POPAL